MWSGIWSVASRIGFCTWIYLWDIVVRGRKWLDFNIGKAQLLLFDQSNNTGTIYVKMNGSVLEEKSSFKMLVLTFFSKLELWFVLWSFFFLRLLYISINLPYNHALNTAIMPGMMLLVATWNCWIDYKNRYARWLVFSCCFSWTLGSLLKCSQLKSSLHVLLW